jgi:hypothetical protein
MKIFKISFHEGHQPTMAKVGKMGKMFCNYYYSEPDEGFWIIYSDEQMTTEQVYENLTDENLDKYLNN